MGEEGEMTFSASEAKGFRQPKISHRVKRFEPHEICHITQNYSQFWHFDAFFNFDWRFTYFGLFWDSFKVYENQTSKMKFFEDKDFFSWISISKMSVKMNLRIITKNHAADPEIGFLTKSISKPYCRATAIPPAWELK